jgi:hypothetical protein
MIISGGIIGGAIPGIIQTDTGSYNSTSISTITFTARDLGLAGRKHIAIAVGWIDTDNLTAVSVDGISATQVAVAAVAGGRESAIWIASVPTSTSGDVVLTFAGNVPTVYAGIYALYNLRSATAVDTATATGATGSTYFLDLSANIDARGVVVAVFAGGGVTNTPVPTGLSNETVLRNISAIRVYSADYTATAAETPRTMGWTLNGFVAGCLATFR